MCVLASSFTLFIPSHSLVLFTPILTFLPFPTHCSAHGCLGHLFPSSCPLISWYKNKQGGGFCQSLSVLVAFSAACCSRCSKSCRPHSLAGSGCSQLPLKGWDFTDAQSAFLRGWRAQNYPTLLQFQHAAIFCSAQTFKDHSWHIWIR